MYEKRKCLRSIRESNNGEFFYIDGKCFGRLLVNFSVLRKMLCGIYKIK